MDILSFLKDHGIPYELSGKNLSKGRIGVCCPFCYDSGFHGAFTPDGEVYTCWKCGWKPINEILRKLTGLQYLDLQDYDGTSILQKIERKEARGIAIELPGGPLEDVHKKYLRKRGLNPDIMEGKYGLRGTTFSGTFNYRIIIPLQFEGRIASFTSRDYTGLQELRYKTLSIEKSIIDPKALLFNQDFALENSIMVSEGPFDAFKLGDGAVATLGTSVTETQIRKMAMYENIYIVFDPEVQAQLRAKKLAERLAVLGKNVEIINIGGDKDPGDLDENSIKILRKELNFSIDKKYLNF